MSCLIGKINALFISDIIQKVIVNAKCNYETLLALDDKFSTFFIYLNYYEINLGYY
jgi:hypothetical protein